MQIVIIGAGEVGTTIADSLAADHEVVVVEIDSTRAEEITYNLDVLPIVGDGTSSETLESADAERADLVIACTDDDRTNLVACGTVKTLGDAFTIARTKHVEYFDTWTRTRSAFGVDFMVCTNLLTAEKIVRIIGMPAAIDVDPFAEGVVQMAEFEIGAESPIAGHTVAEADRFESLTFAGLFRAGEMILPRGETSIEPGDRAVVIGSPESVQSFARQIAPEQTPGTADDVVIVGGSEVGYQLARLLEAHTFSPRLIEQDPERARWLAERLPRTSVMKHDATDAAFLSREHVDEADIIVSAMESDEKNLLESLLAKRMGVERVVSSVKKGEYVSLFEEIGIDVAINPRQVTAEEIIRFTHETVAENIAVLENDRAEVVELELTVDGDLTGREISEVAESIDRPFVIGAITRNGALVTPRGETVLRAGDHVILFVETSFVNELTAMA